MKKVMSVIGVAMLASCSPAYAQAVCMDTLDMYTALNDRYEESRMLSGFAADGTLMEVWANPDKDTWTLLRTTSEGESCVLTTGGYFETFEYRLKPNL